MQGLSYAIPTKDAALHTLPLARIGFFVEEFLVCACMNPELTFDVVRVGCGLAGYREDQMAPLFVGAPSNVNLPAGWRKFENG